MRKPLTLIRLRAFADQMRGVILGTAVILAQTWVHIFTRFQGPLKDMVG